MSNSYTVEICLNHKREEMETNYTDHYNIPVNLKVEESNGGVMITLEYAQEDILPEVPLLSEHSSMGDTTYISVHHVGLSDFSWVQIGDGDDFLELEGETEREIDLLENGRFFCCDNQILILER